MKNDELRPESLLLLSILRKIACLEARNLPLFLGSGVYFHWLVDVAHIVQCLRLQVRLGLRPFELSETPCDGSDLPRSPCIDAEIGLDNYHE